MKTLDFIMKLIASLLIAVPIVITLHMTAGNAMMFGAGVSMMAQI